MRTGSLVVLVAAAGCADPVVDLQLRLPDDPALDNTSCVTTVELYANGNNYPANENDYTSSALSIASSPATYADVQAAIRGKFDVPLPESGLATIEMYGWSGDPGWELTAVPPELVFYARGDYTGDETVIVPITPNISCARKAVTVRPLDLLAFIATPPPYACANGAVADVDAGISVGTLTPAVYEDNEVLFWGGFSGSTLAGGIAQFDAATTVGPGSCLALSGGNLTAGAIACANGRGVCAAAGELENVWVDGNIAFASLDPTLANLYKGFVVGIVLDGAKQPIQGATVVADETLAETVYVDYDAAAAKFKPVAGTSTSASGLFILYTNAIVPTTISGGGKSKVYKLGAAKGVLSAVAAVLN